MTCAVRILEQSFIPISLVLVGFLIFSLPFKKFKIKLLQSDNIYGNSSKLMQKVYFILASVICFGFSFTSSLVFINYYITDSDPKMVVYPIVRTGELGSENEHPYVIINYKENHVRVELLPKDKEFMPNAHSIELIVENGILGYEVIKDYYIISQ